MVNVLGTQIDAMLPANIGAEWDGGWAMTITVLANPEGQAFDVEAGNVSGVRVAPAIHERFTAGLWSVGYVNESLCDTLTLDLAAVGLDWTDASRWPNPGVYLWAADPSENIFHGSWRPPVTPLLIQDRYLGPVDLSTAHPNFTGTVAGYLDGAVSAWPASAWARFKRLPDRNPSPAPPVPKPAPPAPTSEDDPLYFIQTPAAWYQVFASGMTVQIPDPTDGSGITAKFPTAPVVKADDAYAQALMNTWKQK